MASKSCRYSGRLITEERLGLPTVSLFIGFLILALLRAADARDVGQWGHQPPHIREWFKNLVQPDAPHLSCCGEADAYEADLFESAEDPYVAVITDGSGDPAVGKPEITNGTRFVVPRHKVKWDDRKSHRSRLSIYWSV